MSDESIAHIGELLARFSDGETEVVDELVAPEYYTYVPGPDEPTATDVYRRFATELRAAAPDLRVELVDPVSEADGVIAGDIVIGGTWKGELWGAPPSRQRYEFTIPVRIRPAGHRFAFEAGLTTPDALGLLRSLGLVNPPDQMHLPPRYPIVIDDFLIKVLFTGQVADRYCSHLADIAIVSTEATACDDCADGDIWPALRMCLICGHVGCCDTSTHKHAKAHWERTGHPLIRSIRMDEGWAWCYEDDAVFQKRTLLGIAAMLGQSM